MGRSGTKGAKKNRIVFLTTTIALCGSFSAAFAQGVTEEWVRRFNGPNNGVDVALHIALDPTENVYVAGETGFGVSSDFYLIKYSPDGSVLCSAREDFGGRSDRLYAIFVDTRGEIYLTGTSEIIVREATTVKYDSNCVKLWSAIFNSGFERDGGSGARDLTVDPNGNVYITGAIRKPGARYGNIDYLTVKYDANGVQLWSATYAGPGIPSNETDFATAIDVDPNGNVYVTGVSLKSAGGEGIATVSYDSTGQERWVRRYDNGLFSGATDLEVNAAGFVFVAGTINSTSGADVIIIQYDADGFEQWVALHDSGGVLDVPRKLVLEDDGNIYITGTTGGGGLTAKFSGAGALLWAVTRLERNDFSTISLRNGNVYVAGRETVQTGEICEEDPFDETGEIICYSIFSPGNYITVKYDRDGNEKWAIRYDGGDEDVAKGIAVDEAENVYVTGGSKGVGTSYDFATVKYSQAGCIDSDGDGFFVGDGCTPLDCDDNNANIHPGAEELCDEIDNNCNSSVDEPICGDSTDRDCDTVQDCTEDQCLGSVPDTTPLLKPNHYTLYNLLGSFTMGLQKERTAQSGVYTNIHMTHGCTCEQIISVTEIGKGHSLHGCSRSLLEIFTGLSGEPDHILISPSH